MPALLWTSSPRRIARTDTKPLPVRRAAGYAALIWVVAFIAAHVYWYLGGRIGHPGALPDARLDAFIMVVVALFVAGVIVPLASVSGWGRAIPRWMLLGALWAGCAILVVRGGAGIVDEVLRVTELSPTGLTGLTREEVTGSADPSANTLWSGRESSDLRSTEQLEALVEGIEGADVPGAEEGGIGHLRV